MAIPMMVAAAAMLSAIGLIQEGRCGVGGPGRVNRLRPCINCGREHEHSNAFCSADCCRAHRMKAKKGGEHDAK